MDWSKSANDLHNLIRGLSPFPASVTTFRGKLVKIMRSEVSSFVNESKTAGQIIAVGKNGPIDVQTGDGILSILELKPEGKKTMSAGEFHRGSRVESGESFI